jgi:GR25 family glycosyltransferase involved in LPS biosynthesis
MKLLWILVILLFLILLQTNNKSGFGGKSSFGSNECVSLPNIDKIFVLSLKKSEERRNNFLNSYIFEIPLQIIWGIDTTKPENAEPYRKLVNPYNFSIMYDLDSGKRDRKKNSEFNSGALGCYLGHMEFYKESFSQKLKYALICEDTIVFSPNFLSEWKSLKVPSDFDIIFFHAWNTIGKNNTCNKQVKSLKKVMGTKCYLVNVESMKKYYNFFYPIDNHIDFKYEDIIKQGCRVYYYPLESINVVYTSESSTIGHSVIKSDLVKDADPNKISHILFEME